MCEKDGKELICYGCSSEEDEPPHTFEGTWKNCPCCGKEFTKPVVDTSELEKRKEELKQAIEAEDPKKIAMATIRVLMADDERMKELANFGYYSFKFWFEEGWRPISGFTEEELMAELKIREKPTDEEKCDHSWVYSGRALLSDPPQYPKICSKCGKKENESGMFGVHDNEYDELVRKFGAKSDTKNRHR